MNLSLYVLSGEKQSIANPSLESEHLTSIATFSESIISRPSSFNTSSNLSAVEDKEASPRRREQSSSIQSSLPRGKTLNKVRNLRRSILMTDSGRNLTSSMLLVDPTMLEQDNLAGAAADGGGPSTNGITTLIEEDEENLDDHPKPDQNPLAAVMNMANLLQGNHSDKDAERPSGSAPSSAPNVFGFSMSAVHLPSESAAAPNVPVKNSLLSIFGAVRRSSVVEEVPASSSDIPSSADIEMQSSSTSNASDIAVQPSTAAAPRVRPVVPKLNLPAHPVFMTEDEQLRADIDRRDRAMDPRVSSTFAVVENPMRISEPSRISMKRVTARQSSARDVSAKLLKFT